MSKSKIAKKSKFKKINKGFYQGLPFVILITLIVMWESIARLFKVPDYLLPSPLAIGKSIVKSSDILYRHTQATFVEVLIGFAVAFTVGFILSVGISHSNLLRKVFLPMLIASQTVPVIVIAPLLVIWFGYGMLPKIIAIVIICFFPIVINTTKGLGDVDSDIIKLMQSFGANKKQLFTKVKLPNALPSMFAGIKIAVTLSVIGAVIAEWMGADEGLGYLIQVANAQLDTKLTFSAIAILILIGLMLYGTVAIVERKLIPWANND